MYLKTPWYSSGIDERLAVVLKTGIEKFDHGNKQVAVTTWSNDPLKLSSAITNIYPNIQHFNFLEKGTDDSRFYEPLLTAEESSGAYVSIAVYNVHPVKPGNTTIAMPDEDDRHLYYADIMVNFDLAYFPFVKLALAAYQQHSVRKYNSSVLVEDCCLSKIVQADYIQIPPPRSTSCKIVKHPFQPLEQKPGVTSVTVVLTGPVPVAADEIVNNEIHVRCHPAIRFTLTDILPASEGVLLNVRRGFIKCK